MKITSEQLRRIIKEEIEHVLDEAAGQEMKEKATLSFSFKPTAYVYQKNPNLKGIEGSEDTSFHSDHIIMAAREPFIVTFSSALADKKTYDSVNHSEIYNTIYNAYKAMREKGFNYKDARYQKLQDLVYAGEFGNVFKKTGDPEEDKDTYSLTPESFEFQEVIGLNRRRFNLPTYDGIYNEEEDMYEDIPVIPRKGQEDKKIEQIMKKYGPQNTGDTNE